MWPLLPRVGRAVHSRPDPRVVLGRRRRGSACLSHGGARLGRGARLAEQPAHPCGRRDRRLHGARHCGGPVDEAGQRAAEQRTRDGGTEGIAVVLEQVVPRRCEARLEPRQRRVDLGKGEADLENQKGVKSATLVAPRRGPTHALRDPSERSSALEPGGPPCASARAPRAVGGQPCRCRCRDDGLGHAGGPARVQSTGGGARASNARRRRAASRRRLSAA